MKAVAALAACSFAVGVAIALLSTPSNALPAPRQTVGLFCFKTGEQLSGLNRICYYNCAGSEAAITVPAGSICPVSINR